MTQVKLSLFFFLTLISVSACGNPLPYVSMAEQQQITSEYINGKTHLEIFTEKDSYPAGIDEVILEVENNGAVPADAGIVYYLEKYQENYWYRFSHFDESIVNDILYLADPNDSFRQTIPLHEAESSLSPGNYRIVKAIEIQGEPEDVLLAAEFLIED